MAQYTASSPEIIAGAINAAGQASIQQPITGGSEVTPLMVPGDAPNAHSPSSPNSARRTSDALFEVADRLKSTGGKSFQTVMSQAIKVKNSMRSSPWLLSTVVGFSCLSIVSQGVFAAIGNFFTIQPVHLVLNAYQIMFGLTSLTLEMSRHMDLFGCRSMLRKWMPFLDINVGRGIFHLLTAVLAAASGERLTEMLPGIFLGIVAILEIVWGVRCALKIRQLMEKLGRDEETSEKSLTASLRVLQTKFAALDLNGDGKLSKEELEIGCRSVGLELKPGELGMIFGILDPKGKGWIALDDLEVWWVGNKEPSALLQV